MATRAEKIRLGVFLATALVLFAGTLFFLVGREILGHRSEYLIRFRESVHGLEQGSPVKLRGVRVGSVESIRISPTDVEVIEVRISVEPGTPIKQDAEAVMNMQGITGMKFIEIRGGTRESPLLKPGGEIKAGQAILDQLTGDVTGIAQKVDELLEHFLSITRPENQELLESTLENANQLSTRLDDVLDEVEQTLETTHAILKENRRPVHSTIVNLERTSGHLEQTLAQLDATLGEARTAIAEAQVGATTEELRKTSASVRTTLENLQLRRAVDGTVETLAALRRVLDGVASTVGQNQESIRQTIQNLQRASDSLKDMTRTFQEKPVIQVFGREPKERKLP